MKRFCSIILLFISSCYAETIHFGSDVTHSKWEVISSREECRLVQKVRDFGILSFIQRAGRPIHYDIHSWHEARPGMAGKLTLVPPPWRHDRQAKELYTVKLKSGRNILSLDPYETQRLVIALEEGLIVRMQYPIEPKEREDSYIVDASTVDFRKMYDDYQLCVDKLLPYDFEEISFLSVFFNSEGTHFDKEDKNTLNKVIHYVKSGAKVSQIIVAGYADKRGRYHYNRKIARARAEAVKSYLLVHDVPPDLVKIEDTTRRGGYTFSDDIPDEENRRATIRLVH